MKAALLSILATTAMLASTAQARILSLDMQGRQYGPGQAVALKQEIQRAYPRLDMRNFDLVQVTVQAKSFDRRGDISLRVGNSQSERRALRGDPRDWDNPRRYDLVSFRNPDRDSRGAWQIIMQGTRFKVGRVDVEVVALRNEPRPPPRDPRDDPRDRYVDIHCASQDYRPMLCPVNFQITRVVLLEQLSEGRGQCIEGRSYYATRDGLQVNGGCRGRFRVFGR
ncbi:MAG: DUF3011 domain-containing protein [Bdellovibrionota bacterium]